MYLSSPQGLFSSSSRPNQRSGRRAASTIEFALVSPIMLLLVFGIIELGRAYMVTEMLTEAARKACRVAIIPGATSQQIKDAATQPLTICGISGESVGISVNGAPVDTVDPSQASPNSNMSIIVSVPAANISWLPVTHYVTTNLTGQFSMRRE